MPSPELPPTTTTPVLEAPPAAEPDGSGADEHAAGIPTNVTIGIAVNGIVQLE
jgi:hypothetical protein